MNVTFIGASGFVGTRLIELLKLNSDYQLKNIDKNQSPVYPEITIFISNFPKTMQFFHKND